MWFFALARAATAAAVAAIFAESPPPPVSGSPPPSTHAPPPLPLCWPAAATGNNLSMHLRLSLRKFYKKKEGIDRRQ